ncbi:helix-turn-helix domain-containing protein [Dokdonella sp.]|uniref:helix-turn-helix domain-containing protein n=1 Tax=Dokdonella sp. TaxID=2291710 RepID=UPI0031C15E26|nr:helix-turn-helix domain-containing protein [Dokdonella sp.]
MGYAHLSQDERYQIQCLHDGGFAARQIAHELQQSPSTISRELACNAGKEGDYRARQAHRPHRLNCTLTPVCAPQSASAVVVSRRAMARRTVSAATPRSFRAPP